MAINPRELIEIAQKEAGVVSTATPTRQRRYFTLAVRLWAALGPVLPSPDVLLPPLRAYCAARPSNEPNDVILALEVAMSAWGKIHGSQFDTVVALARSEPIQVVGLREPVSQLFTQIMSFAFHTNARAPGKPFKLVQKALAVAFLNDEKERGLIFHQCNLGVRRGFLTLADNIGRCRAYLWNPACPYFLAPGSPEPNRVPEARRSGRLKVVDDPQPWARVLREPGEEG